MHNRCIFIIVNYICVHLPLLRKGIVTLGTELPPKKPLFFKMIRSALINKPPALAFYLNPLNFQEKATDSE